MVFNSDNGKISNNGTLSDACISAANELERVYHVAPTAFAFTPYRICPLGAHTDHQLGLITGFAIDKGIHMAYAPTDDGSILVNSLQFSAQAQWSVSSVPSTKQNDWADHLRGATLMLSRRFSLRVGVKAVLNGELPIGGLSSSAAVILTFLTALSRVNGISLSPQELITLSRAAENEYVGVACGKLDQSCEVYCQKNHLLVMDMADDSMEYIPQSPNSKPYRIAVFFSGLERSLAGSGYNTRVDECKSTAYALMAYAGLDYGRYQDACLRQVPFEVYRQYKDKLPIQWAKRAEHFYTENQRVQNGVKAFRNGDMDTFGRLIFESGHSSVYHYEAGSAELIRLYEIMLHTKGIYGGRFSGAGFKGCCIAFMNPDYEEEILQSVEREYTAAFPHLKNKYGAFLCQTADGIGRADIC